MTQAAATTFERRLRPSDPARAHDLSISLGVSATVAQVLLHRGVVDAASGLAFLAPSLAELTDPAGMCDRDAAAERLADAVRRRERVVVFGDYDVDGTTSATILSDVLEALGGEVVPLLASRFGGGYGLSQAALERCLALGPKVLVTCDCGSSDHARIAEARAAGVDVVVIDHHLVPREPLPAVAFLNPHRPECSFAYKGMASAGLAFSVAAAVRARIQPKLDMRPWLDLVALGTIADVAPLDGDNRRLVRAGLARISEGFARPGILALLELAGGRSRGPLGARDVAFKLAPRINAPGRLGDPDVSLRLLRSRDAISARALASEVEQKNQERKAVQTRVSDEALAQVEAYAGERPGHPVLASAETFHRGVVGISAAKVAERFHAPAAVIAVEDGIGHGSVRSFAGFDVHAMLARVSSLLLGFGGHAAAAGFTVRAERIEELREALKEARLDAAAQDRAEHDVDVLLGGGFGLPKASELTRLEPVGAANEAPRVMLEAEVRSCRKVGDGTHRKLELALLGTTLGGFAPAGVEVDATNGQRATFVGILRPDTWKGGEAVQIEIEAARL